MRIALIITLFLSAISNLQAAPPYYGVLQGIWLEPGTSVRTKYVQIPTDFTSGKILFYSSGPTINNTVTPYNKLEKFSGYDANGNGIWTAIWIFYLHDFPSRPINGEISGIETGKLYRLTLSDNGPYSTGKRRPWILLYYLKG